MSALWLEAERELDFIAITNNLGQCPCQLMRQRVLNELKDNSIDIFECVAVPAIDATKSVLRVRISGAFKLAIAEAADRFILAKIGHGNHLH